MPVEQLTRQLDWMASGKVRVMSLAELIERRDDSDAVALTFDDGFVNFGENAAPLLSERGLEATVFVSPGHVGGVNKWDANNASIPSLPLLSWDELCALDKSGVDVGGHGQTHRSLNDLDQATLDFEVNACARSIEEKIGKPSLAFAFPYGDFDENASATVATQFRIACTTEMRIVGRSDQAHALPRIDMYYFRGKSIEDMWGTPAFGAYVKLRASMRSIRTLARLHER